MTRIAYQGVPGAFSEMAARARYPDARMLPMADFTAVVRAVTRGAVELGILPIENVIIGTVEGAQAALDDASGVKVVDEIQFAIHHCLVALPGAKLGAIRRVESHPAALAQCARWLSAHRLPPHAVSDTAGAALSIATDRDFTRAAIAGAEAAARYGLAILARDIADLPDNRTRFVVIQRCRSEVAA